MKILIDNGHGSNTPGKCSPDRRLMEYRWAREIAQMLEKRLKSMGYEAQRIVTEEYDVSIGERCRRVNSICRQVGSKNCVLVSIHIDAAGGDGQWHKASGWSVWVSKTNASSKSKKLAEILYNEAAIRGLKGDRAVPPCKYWSGNFGIVRDTNCAAVLTENMFQDNQKDVNFLLSDAGKNTIVDLHAQGLAKYINSL